MVRSSAELLNKNCPPDLSRIDCTFHCLANFSKHKDSFFNSKIARQCGEEARNGASKKSWSTVSNVSLSLLNNSETFVASLLTVPSVSVFPISSVFAANVESFFKPLSSNVIISFVIDGFLTR